MIVAYLHYEKEKVVGNKSFFAENQTKKMKIKFGLLIQYSSFRD